MVKKEQKSIITRMPLFTFLILMASVLSSISPGMASVFIFDRSAILKGEVWRILTSHFVHFSNLHLFYNLLAFGIAGWIIENKSYRHFGWLCVLMASLISISLFILEPDMSYYGGLSGMACGSIYYFALWGTRGNRPWRTICMLLILLIPIKIVAEIYNSASVLPYGGQLPFVPVPTSHVIGIVVAILLYLVEKYRKSALTNRLTGQQETWRFG
jgi:rhomboid family GlyGly-CTERM serine protease